MKNTIEELKSNILSGNFPVNYPHFGGAGLIVTNNPARHAHTEDLVVLTEHAGAISWLVIQLKGIYEKSIDYSTKYAFYQSIGNLSIEALNQCSSTQSTLEYITDKIILEWPLNNVPESADKSEEGPWP